MGSSFLLRKIIVSGCAREKFFHMRARCFTATERDQFRIGHPAATQSFVIVLR
jgi:hypothetical protein